MNVSYRSTLRDRLLEKVSVDCTRTGPQTVFTLDEEKKLCDHIKLLAEVGYGYTRAEVVNLACDYAIHLGKRTSNNPLTLHWFYNFLSRWPELKVTKPSSLTEVRAKCANEHSIRAYFDELSRIMSKYNLENNPQNIYNIDEKGINTEYRPPHVVAGDSCKAQAIMAERSKTITVIGGGNAIGHQIPPFFVFPGVRLIPDLLQGKSPGADGVMTKSGWSNTEVFDQYMKNHFLTFCQGRNKSDTILVLYDGHKSHVSLGLIEWAKIHNIVLFVLPPHTSHVLQPMDIGCFGPLQVMYSHECAKFVRANHRVVSRYDVCSLACKAYASALSPLNLQSAFRKAGIYPLLGGNAMCENLGLKIKPSTLYQEEDKDDNTSSQVVCSGAADEVSKELEKNAESKRFDGSKHCEIVTESEILVECDEKTGERDFFESMSAVVCKKVSKKRRNVSSVIGGKALEGETVRNLERYLAESSKKSKSTKKSQKTTKKPSNTKPKKIRTIMYSPQPGPSHFCVYDESDAEMYDSDRESNISESEKCCVCKKFYVRQTDLSITNWVQCNVCSHWEHLKYFTPLRVARKNTEFQCKCCI